MSEQQTTTTVQEPPAPDGYPSWPHYWMAQGMPWRTQAQIDEERQAYLAKRRAITPDVEQGIYPFKDIKLDRADVEWLLATHDSGGMRGPVDWSDTQQQSRAGLDLRGADLRRADLHALPLARLRGGHRRAERGTTAGWQDDAAVVHLEESNLGDTHLEGALLDKARLEGAYLRGTRLERAELSEAHLERAFLSQVHLEEARLLGVHLQGTVLVEGTHLEGATLFGAKCDADTELADIRLSSPSMGPPSSSMCTGAIPFWLG